MEFQLPVMFNCHLIAPSHYCEEPNRADGAQLEGVGKHAHILRFYSTEMIRKDALFT